MGAPGDVTAERSTGEKRDTTKSRYDEYLEIEDYINSERARNAGERLSRRGDVS